MHPKPKVRYGSTRLTFKRRLIESLKDDEAFAVDTPSGSFVMTKGEFHRLFPNVVDSRAYELSGIYSYATIPKRAWPFRREPGEVEAQPAEHELPALLAGLCREEDYRRWLGREATAQLPRDERSAAADRPLAAYEDAIHQAVTAGGAVDGYTGDPLDWSLLALFDPQAALAEPKRYKRRFANLPTVVRVGRGLHAGALCTCSWRTAAAKGDLDADEFLDVCRKVTRWSEKLARSGANVERSPCFGARRRG